MPRERRVLILGCGALAREIRHVTDRHPSVDLACLPANLHNRPQLIPDAVDERIMAEKNHYDEIFIAYGDCGTGGLLDDVLERHGVERIPGAHCYEFFTGSDRFTEISDNDPHTFYLTDFLVRNFERIVWKGLALDRHPELLEIYFGNYHRLLYISQFPAPELIVAAERAAKRLGLAFEHVEVGLGTLESAIQEKL